MKREKTKLRSSVFDDEDKRRNLFDLKEMHLNVKEEFAWMIINNYLNCQTENKKRMQTIYNLYKIANWINFQSCGTRLNVSY